MMLDRHALVATLAAARSRLLESRTSGGYWEGELSSSALSTATAVFALAMVDRQRHEPLIRRGLEWLARSRNADGGWGDTVLSGSNISTTALCWAAFTTGMAAEHAPIAEGAEAWLARHAGGVQPAAVADAIAERYGKDRTFSAPILTMCALAGRLGEGRDAWSRVIQLPFELAACPQGLFRWLRLPVVSYALPALIAVGQVRHHHRSTHNPAAWLLRSAIRRRTLDVLTRILPGSGGFLEAVPLTSFVVMSLAGIGQRNHAVVAKGVEFIIRSVRADGSWPIDTNLSTWVTTLSVNALAASPRFTDELTVPERERLRDWLLDQQHVERHPYTNAAPGGWAWTDLPGGVPDADDTAGALLALHNLGFSDPRTLGAVTAGVGWLLGLQNRDGGIPTFCRGWGALPFDRSGADLTAHALVAMAAWVDQLSGALKSRTLSAMARAVDYLALSQREDGSWLPLWFGNELAPDEENPTYGTARVMIALGGLPEAASLVAKGARWLLAAQNADGGWGGALGIASSIEETALAVQALSARPPLDGLEIAVGRGVSWLIEHTDAGRTFPPSPIGLYFAKLWYFERLYPLIFTVSALERVAAR